MLRSTISTVPSDRPHDVGQRLHCRPVAVEHLERLAIMCADTDFEPDISRCRIADHPAHLQSVDFTAEHAMLLERRRATGKDQFDERPVPVVDDSGLGKGFRHGIDEAPTVEVRHLYRHGETERSPGQRARAGLGDQMHAGCVAAHRPRERRPELTIG